MLIQTPVRLFAAPAAKGAAPTPGNKGGPEPLTITQLQEIGYKNLQQTKIFDYNQFALPSVHGLTNKKSSFRSFEDQINTNFPLEQTAPSDRNSKRVGLLGYKIGMTHFWNKWGAIVPCTVIQIDRC